jgi:Domain of unknown function (DUF4157)
MTMTTTRQQLKGKSALANMPMSSGLLQRKCACGNRTMIGGHCAECAKNKSTLQRKLTIGASNDPLEQEADRIADQVMAASTQSTIERAPLQIQRFAGQAGDESNAAPASVDRVLAGSGRPLEPALREDMELRFGHDFSHVRVHSGDAAETSAKDVNAHAYTVGRNIVFGERQFQPHTPSGRRLLAHELTHVVQQNAAKHFVSSTSLTSLERSPIRLQRYTYNQNCSADTRSLIAGGYKLADWSTKRAKTMLDAASPTGALKAWFDFLFGGNAESERKAIAANFKNLNDVMQEDYEFICPPAGTKPCIGAQAEVDDDKNVNICMDRIANFSQAGIARLLIHENVRRAKGRRNVTNINDTLGECNMGAQNTKYSEATTDANHPIPYSCFAEKLITIYLAEQEKKTTALFHNIFGNGIASTFWNGTIMINGQARQVTVSLRTLLADLDFIVLGNYSYRKLDGGTAIGEIPFGIIRFIGPPGRSEALVINFDWKEGMATGKGIWRSAGGTELDGTWGRGESASDGGAWKITAANPQKE